MFLTESGPTDPNPDPITNCPGGGSNKGDDAQPDECDKSKRPDETKKGPAAGCPASKNPINYSNGQIILSATDLTWQGFGFSWDHKRSYANLIEGSSVGTVQGAHWFASSLPYLVFRTQSGIGSTIGLVSGATSTSWFEGDGAGGWRPRLGSTDQLRHDTVKQQYVVTEANGRSLIFHSNDVNLPQAMRGRLKGMENSLGSRAEVVYNEEDQLVAIRWSDSSGSSAAFHYEYEQTPELVGLLAHVMLEVDGKPVRRARYQHAALNSIAATAGDLQLAVIENWQGTRWKKIKEEAYRYYSGDEPDGFVHGLKMVFKPQAVAALREAGLDPLTSMNEQVETFADLQFRFDSEKRVIEERIHGGAESYGYEWLSASPEPVYSAVNTWSRRCTETTPDGNKTIIYSNRGGSELVRIRRETATGRQWVKYNQMNEDYLLILQALPSAVASIGEPTNASGSLNVILKSNEGLVHVYEYYSSNNYPNGEVKGYLKSSSLKKGQSGAAVLLSERTYRSHTVGTVTIYTTWKDWVYPVEGSSRAEAAMTEYEREYYENDLLEPTFQVYKIKSTPPIIPIAQNGTGFAETTAQVYDLEGRLTWTRNARGYISFSAFNPATGAQTRMIQDVDTSRISGVPEGWVTPEDGGRHLVTDYINDSLGRTLKVLSPWIEIDPATVDAVSSEPLQVRRVSYTLYRDADHQVWRAQGWLTGEDEGTSWHILGPVSIIRSNESGIITDEIESPPSCTCGPLGPDTFGKGSELSSQEQWTAWSHANLDLWGREIEKRVYYRIPTTGEGFEGSDYNATRFGFDEMGRQNRHVSPGGTITREVFDVRSLKISAWVGTNDVGASNNDPSGGGTSENNLRATWLGQYDLGLSGGDGNLTQEVLPSSDDSTEDRITTYQYDYRNRQILKAQMEANKDPLEGVETSFRVESHNGNGVPKGVYTSSDFTDRCEIGEKIGGWRHCYGQLLFSEDIESRKPELKVIHGVPGAKFQNSALISEQVAASCTAFSILANFTGDIGAFHQVLVIGSAGGPSMRFGVHANGDTAMFTSVGTLTYHQTWSHKLQLMTIVLEGTQAKLYVDGSLAVEGYVPLTEFQGTTYLGGDWTHLLGGPDPWPGSIVAAIGYDASDREAVESYLMSLKTLNFISGYGTDYDNLNRLVRSRRYHTEALPFNRTHESTFSYDLRGREFESKKFYVNVDGSLGDYLVAKKWYDANGNILKETQQGAKVVTKREFNSLDRLTVESQVAENLLTKEENTNTVSSDIVIEQAKYFYDDNNGLLSLTRSARFDDAVGAGPLQGPNGNSPRSRDTFFAYYADPIGRNRFLVNVGTAGGARWYRPTLHPASSDLILVSEQRYARDGGTSASLDPEGTAKVEVRDAAKRVIRQIENATIMCAEGGVASTRSRATEYSYAPDGGLARLILINSSTGNQVTTWSYGTNVVSSGIARSDLATRKTYPTGEFEVQTYNRQGAIKTHADPNGTVHTYSYDILGRLTDDSITVLAPGIDGMVRRLSKGYDDRGRVQYLTSASDPNTTSGTIINQVKRDYNGIDCLISEAQSHSGTVDSNSPKVQYQCSAAVNNILRNTSVIYPNGRSVSYEYGGADSIDDVINRVQSVHDNDLTVLAEFQYFGVSQPAITSYPQPSVQRRWKKLAGQPTGDAGDPYTGYDRFGRIEQMLWIKDGYVPVPLMHVQWGYNRASLKTWRKDLLAPNLANQDQYFTYDDLYQVTERQLGLLNTNTTGVSGIAEQQENFVYDETGNWLQYKKRVDGELEVDQKRGNNQGNQIICIDSNGTSVSYDKNGNMLEVPTGGLSLDGQPRELVWDAWNRLRKVSDAADNELAKYEYDALTRRTVSMTATTRHCYYNDQWRSVEERIGSSASSACQHVWHPMDRWELLFRDRSTANNGTLDERLYSLKDQLDPVAICDASGEIQERYAYSAFGITTVLDENFEERTVGESDFAWNWLFHGEFRDEVTDWYNYGYRYYGPDLGRWLSRDPIEESGGVNLYVMGFNNCIRYFDQLGLEPQLGDFGVGPQSPIISPDSNCAGLVAYPNKTIQHGEAAQINAEPELMTLPQDRRDKRGIPGVGCRIVAAAGYCREKSSPCERHVVIYVPSHESWNDPQTPNFHAIGQLACGDGDYYHQGGNGGPIYGPLNKPNNAAPSYYAMTPAGGPPPPLTETHYCCPDNL